MVNLAAVHFGADPIADVAVNDNLTAAHFRAEVHAGRATDSDASARHAGADQLDAGAIAFDGYLPIAGVTVDGEELGEALLAWCRAGPATGRFREGLAGKLLGVEHSASTGIWV